LDQDQLGEQVGAETAERTRLPLSESNGNRQLGAAGWRLMGGERIHGMMMTPSPNSYTGYRFPAAVVSHAV